MIPVPIVVGINQQFFPNQKGLFVRARVLSFDAPNVVLQGLTAVPLLNGLADFHRLRIMVPNFTQAIRVALQFTVAVITSKGLRELPATTVASRPFIVSPDAQMQQYDPLLYAAKAGDAVAVVEALRQPTTAPYMRCTALHVAAAAGQGPIVRLLLATHTPTNARDADDDTALHAAALSGNISACAHLLDAGADPNAENNVGFTPLHYAAVVQDVAMFELLAFHGSPIKANSCGATPGELFPEGMTAVNAVLARKEQELITSIRDGSLFGVLVAAAAAAPTESPVSSVEAHEVPGSPGSVQAASSGSDAEFDMDEDSANEEEPESMRQLNDERKRLAASSAVLLKIVSGIEPPLFKDSPLRLRFQVVPNSAVEGSQRTLKRLMGRLGGRTRVTLHLEDAHGQPVREVAKGRRSGARIINQDEFDVALSPDGSFELVNVRIREVSRNHSGGSFRMIATLSNAQEVAPAVSRSFHVLSERIRAPSYRNQISRQRERRLRRAQATPL